MAKQEWKDNKGRRPYAEDVFVDVKLRSRFADAEPEQRNHRPAGNLDWTIDNVPGDVLQYRKSEEKYHVKR